MNKKKYMAPSLQVEAAECVANMMTLSMTSQVGDKEQLTKEFFLDEDEEETTSVWNVW